MDSERLKRLDSLFEAFSVAAQGSYVFICDMKHDYSRWSKSAVDYFNLPDCYMHCAGEIWEEHIHPEDRKSFRMNIDRIFSGSYTVHDIQYRAFAADGSCVVCTCKGRVINDFDGNPEYFAGIIKNHGLLSYVDTVTGLRSLYGFFDDIKTLSWKKIVSVGLMVGISGFSTVNDVYGYTFGNNVLRKLGALIRESFGDAGMVYRMDGTKFAVISRSLSQERVIELYKQLQEKVMYDLTVDNERVVLSLSAGVMMIDDFDIESETIYSCLKYVYYESKNRHLGELVVFENILSDDQKKLIEKINVIRSSVVDNCKGFFLCYQPIIHSATEKLKGIEALVRWKSEEYGVVPPIQFIPVLEQDMLFPELGLWILKRAMTDGKLFLEKYPDIVINVNISYAQIEKAGFIDDVFSVLEETGFPPENLCLEITERCRLLDIEILKNMVVVFRNKGIKIAIDDFGTGFSSIGILRELPVDTVKIDRQFVKDIEVSESDQRTVEFISDLADSFSAEVCVEGVETSEMRDCLRNFKVNSFQGYYYSKPISKEEFINKQFN